jgi:hypothetical protein
VRVENTLCEFFNMCGCGWVSWLDVCVCVFVRMSVYECEDISGVSVRLTYLRTT